MTNVRSDIAFGQIHVDMLGQRCALIFVCITFPVLIVLALIIQPFGGPDEAAHFSRSIALSHGQIIPINVQRDQLFDDLPTAGGLIDDGAIALMNRLCQKFGRPLSRTTVNELRFDLRFSNGGLHYLGHSNTAIYPPFLYAASTLAVWLARAAGLPVLVWLYAARIANVLVSSILIFRTIKKSRDLAPFLLLSSSLPITLFQISSLSADSLLFALVLLFSGTISRFISGCKINKIDGSFMAAATFVIASGKVAYTPLALLAPIAAFLGSREKKDRWQFFIIWFVAGVFCWGGWAWVVRHSVHSIRPGIYVDPNAQLAYLLGNPFASFRLFARAIYLNSAHNLLEITGSKLGWYAVAIPKPFSIVVLVLWTTIAVITPRKTKRSLPMFIFCIAMSILCFLVIYLLIYLQFNAVGSLQIIGVQGRYFLPLAIVAFCLIPQFRLSSNIFMGLAYAGMALSILSSIITVLVVYQAFWV